MKTASNNTNNGYFNLHANGFGYLQRIRDVAASKGKSYVACDINSLQGPSDDTKKLRFDLIVTGASAQADVEFIRDYVARRELANPTILVSFRASDLEPTFFEFKNGPKKGTQGTCVKARLIRLSYSSIDGVVIELPSAQVPVQDDEQSAIPDMPEAGPVLVPRPAAAHFATVQVQQPYVSQTLGMSARSFVASW